MYSFCLRQLSCALTALDRFFDRLYGSKLNPLYRSGTLAVSLFAIAIVTGCLLLFWYSLSAPYESMQAIQQNAFLARWIRNLHRYSSDLSVLVVAFHIFRMLAEGKSWGPRTLAWLTGTLLSLLMFVIGWTGFVLIWDQQGQSLAVAGAHLLGRIPFLSAAIQRSVSGATVVGSSFFFMNLFLHMSLPLAAIVILWIHTSKLNRPEWILPRKYFLTLFGFLFVFSALTIAPLGGPADLLNLNRDFKLNLFFAFPIALVEKLGAFESFLLIFAVFLALFFLPFYFKPRAEAKPLPAKHNPTACTGCGQCDLDCPFEAIDMVPRTEGTGSETIAFVDTSACVSCGICTASCSQMAIGPEDKSSRLQMKIIKDLKSQAPAGSPLLVYCSKNPLSERILQDLPGTPARYPISCTGNLHVASAHFALSHFGKVQIISCPAEACVNRLGQKRLEQRFLDKRPPEAPARMNFSQVEIYSGSVADYDEISSRLRGIRPQKEKAWWSRLKIVAATSVPLFAVAGLSSFPYTHFPSTSYLRLAIRLPIKNQQICRQRTEQELQSLPQHMRTPTVCQSTTIEHQIEVTIDGKKTFIQKMSASGVNSDKPALLEKDLELSPGTHKVSVLIQPVDSAMTEALKAIDQFETDFTAGRAVLVYFNSNSKNLVHTQTPVK